MAKVTRSNPRAFDVLTARLKELDGQVTKVGWFPGSVYENGAPIAGVAYVQEHGAHINHPGGTPYKIGPDGKAIFVAKSSPGAENLPVTKPHPIVIPPRPFMRPTIDRERNNWSAFMKWGAKAVLDGKMTAHNVMDILGGNAAGQVAQSIRNVSAPPLKPSTIRARLHARSDQETVGNLDKPLVDWGDMINSVTHTVEKDK